MSYSMRIEPRDGYLAVAAEGPFTSLAAAVQLWSKVAALCAQERYGSLLFVREGEFLRNPVDAHMLARTLCDLGFDRIRLAFAAPQADESMLAFVERVALQSGVRGRAFKFADDARVWLEEQIALER